MIPYGKQYIDDDDINAVTEVLRSDWLTTGPKIEEFEKAFASLAGTNFSVAVNSGTAALHSAMYAIGIKESDEVIVPTITFAATANSVLYQGGKPVFADVDPSTLLIDLADVERKITSKTKAIVSVDYAGQAADYKNLKKIADEHKLYLIADACHAIGGSYYKKPVGSLADLSTFSFHPVKNLTTGEGGMITTDNEEFYYRMKSFRNHGITTDHRQRAEEGSWFYEMQDLGYNYRITDFQCALGISQVSKLPFWIKKRREIAKLYDSYFKDSKIIIPLNKMQYNCHAYHLYVIKIIFEKLSIDRQHLFQKLRQKDIGVNVHYIPVHQHPYYKKLFNNNLKNTCPNAEVVYHQILSLPIFPNLSKTDVGKIASEISTIIKLSKK